MTLDGTVNGDSAKPLEYPHPMAPYDLAKEVALLQASHDDWVAGDRGQTLEEFVAEFERDRVLPRMSA